MLFVIERFWIVLKYYSWRRCCSSRLIYKSAYLLYWFDNLHIVLLSLSIYNFYFPSHSCINLASIIINADIKEFNTKWLRIFWKQLGFSVEVVKAYNMWAICIIVQTRCIVFHLFWNSPFNYVANFDFKIARIKTFVINLNSVAYLYIFKRNAIWCRKLTFLRWQFYIVKIGSS